MTVDIVALNDSVPNLLANPAVVDLLAVVGDVNRDLGFDAGYRACEAEMAARWAAAAKPIRDVLKMPTHAELQRRRGHLTLVKPGAAQ